MDDYPGQPPQSDQPTPAEEPAAPPAPPAPPVAPPPPPPPAPAAYAPPAAPPAAAAPAAAPPKKKTWLWVLLAIVGLGLIGCCIASFTIGGGLLSLIGLADDPAASIDAINQAALDGDRAAYEKYFDTESIVRLAYPAFLEYLKTTPEYTELVSQMGEEEADRIVREDIMPEDSFVEGLMAEYDIDSLGENEVPFPDYSVTGTSIENDTAELTINTVQDGENVEYVLGMVKEEYEGESIWRVKEVKNIADFFKDL